MATTLLQQANDEDAARQQALEDALNASDLALTADRAAEVQLLAAATAADAARAALEAVRRALAVAETPAVVAALSLQLKAATVAQRSAVATLATQELLRAQAAAALEAARGAADFARTAKDTSAAALTRADVQNARRQDIIGRALVQPPLQDVAADAAVALASPAFTAARARIEGALPQALRERARERARQAAEAAEQSLTRLQAAQNAFDEEVEASGLDVDTLARLQRAFDRADLALSAYASQAVSRLASSTAALTRLAALTTDPLTPEQKTSLDDLQGTARPDAAAAEGERDDAALVLAEAAAVYAAERLKALATDPAGDLAVMEADAANFPDLVQARTDFDAAQADHATKAVAFSAPEALLVAEWQAEVPDALWSEAASFYAIEDTLTELSTAPAGLVTALQGAEAALVDALEDAAERQRRLEFVAATLAAEQMRAGAVAKRAAERSANALRGALDLAPLLHA